MSNDASSFASRNLYDLEMPINSLLTMEVSPNFFVEELSEDPSKYTRVEILHDEDANMADAEYNAEALRSFVPSRYRQITNSYVIRVLTTAEILRISTQTVSNEAATNVTPISLY